MLTYRRILVAMTAMTLLFLTSHQPYLKKLFPMKSLSLLVSLSLLISINSFCFARLYESPSQTKVRYGTSVTEPSVITLPLMKGTTEKWYHHNGWRIRSAYLNNKTVMITYQKLGRQGTPETSLKEDEIQAILKAEAAGHYWKKVERGTQLTKSKKYQSYFKSSSKLWINPNGSVAWVPGGIHVFCLISKEGLALEINQVATEERQRKESIKSF